MTRSGVGCAGIGIGIGIGIGKAKHYVAAAPRHGENFIRSVEVFTEDLDALKKAVWVDGAALCEGAMAYYPSVATPHSRGLSSPFLQLSAGCYAVSQRPPDFVSTTLKRAVSIVSANAHVRREKVCGMVGTPELLSDNGRWPVDVDVWHVEIPAENQLLARTRLYLDQGERLRASRYRLPQDRMAFMLTRSALREFLAQRVGGGPESLRFSVGVYGPGLSR